MISKAGELRVKSSDAGVSGQKAGMIRRFFRWLQGNSDRRSSLRESGKGLMAFYWDGGTPQGHRVRDISRSGAYVEAGSFAWSQGTLIILTLQIASNGGADSTPVDMMAVPAEVVRTCADGMAVRFLFSDTAGRLKFRRFLSRWKANSAALHPVPASERSRTDSLTVAARKRLGLRAEVRDAGFGADHGGTQLLAGPGGGISGQT